MHRHGVNRFVFGQTVGWETAQSAGRVREEYDHAFGHLGGIAQGHADVSVEKTQAVIVLGDQYRATGIPRTAAARVDPDPSPPHQNPLRHPIDALHPVGPGPVSAEDLKPAEFSQHRVRVPICAVRRIARRQALFQSRSSDRTGRRLDPRDRPVPVSGQNLQCPGRIAAVDRVAEFADGAAFGKPVSGLQLHDTVLQYSAIRRWRDVLPGYAPNQISELR